MSSYRRSLLEMLVENGHSTKKIMEMKDYWDWKEVTKEDIERKLKELRMDSKTLEEEN
tara:strand:- start:453 stop:626 length:174 start_codon:yes stop_codon:yes gene_type:complete